MSLEYINKAYGLNVKIGDRVEFKGTPGTVTGVTVCNRLLIQLDGVHREGEYHPNWGLKFIKGSSDE